MSDSSEVLGPIRAENALDFFRDRFGLDDRSLESAMGAALERRVDHADLFFEYTTQDSVALEEGIVKSGSRHLDQGVGVRAQSGERQGYAHSDEISTESIALAAGAARAICAEHAADQSMAVGRPNRGVHELYPVERAPTDVPVEEKIGLLEEIDAYARSLDPCVKQVMASVVTQHRNILIAASDGTLASDVQPLVRLNVQVIAARGEQREVGYEGAGGRYELARLMQPDQWKKQVEEAVRIARLNLDAEDCPAGSMDVVLCRISLVYMDHEAALGEMSGCMARGVSKCLRCRG